MTEIPPPNLHEITNRVLRQWISVTGVDPSDNKESWTWGDLGIRQINEYIGTAQDIDATGLTAFMVARTVAHDYVRDYSFNALDLVNEDPDGLEELEAFRKLIKLTNDESALETVSKFQDQLREGADHYGVREKVEESITDLDALSHIRRDALICTTLLKQHTFARGPKAKGDLRYNARVLKFWNMSSLIRAAEVQPEDGISIILVRDPQVIEYSFFCFLVKDGKNITIWTDAEPGAHPMQKHMRRGAGRARQLDERISRLRFPYQLLEAKFDDEGKRVREIKGSDLVRTNTEAVAISPIEDLEPDQILWALMALDVLKDAGHKEDLSGTGEGMAYRLPPGTKALPPGYLETVDLSHEAVNWENLRDQGKAGDIEAYDSTGVNAWMEERYRDQVDPRLYNFTLLPDDQGLGEEDEDDEDTPQALVWVNGERIDPMTLLPKARGVRHKMEYNGNDTASKPQLLGVDPVSFGTRERMEADRLWVARWNQAQALSMAAVAEFDQRRSEVARWFEDRVRSNADYLAEKMGHETFQVRTSIHRRIRKKAFENETGGLDSLIRWRRKVSRGGDPYSWDFREGKDTCVSLFEMPRQKCYPTSNDPLRCFFTGKSASYWTLFEPKSPEGIAALAGVPLSDIPELLEFWTPDPPYCGNSILCRTDPLDSQVGNPWTALKFTVLMGMSKTEWNRRARKDPSFKEIRWKIYKQDRDGGYWGYEDEDD